MIRAFTPILRGKGARGKGARGEGARGKGAAVGSMTAEAVASPVPPPARSGGKSLGASKSLSLRVRRWHVGFRVVTLGFVSRGVC